MGDPSEMNSQDSLKLNQLILTAIDGTISPTDLVLDGVIDIDDLMAFVESWAQDTYWP